MYLGQLCQVIWYYWAQIIVENLQNTSELSSYMLQPSISQFSQMYQLLDSNNDNKGCILRFRMGAFSTDVYKNYIAEINKNQAGKFSIIFNLKLENLPASGRFFSFSLDKSQVFRLFIVRYWKTDSNRSDFQLSRFGSTAVCLPKDRCNWQKFSRNRNEKVPILKL